MEVTDDTRTLSVDDVAVNVDTKRRRKVEGVLDMMNVKNFADLDVSWREQALCQDNELFATEDFFYVSVTRKNIQRVLAIYELCEQCPVAANCLHEAMLFNYDGCWAGYTAQQRTAYIRSERDNTVVGLTVDECQTILNDLRGTVEKPMTRAARRAKNMRRPPV